MKWLKYQRGQPRLIFYILLLVCFSLLYLPLSLVLRKITITSLKFPLQFFSTRAWDLKQLLRYRYLAQENAHLKGLLASYRQNVLRLEETARENQRLRSLFSFKEANPYQQITAARVIGRDVSNWTNTIIIDRGVKDGIKTDFVVINNEGLVGKIVEVNPSTSLVLLITDQDSRVSAILAESREQGIVVGSQSSFIPLCRMKYVPFEAQVKEAEGVLTAGLGGVYPKGILLGKVLKAEKNVNQPYQTILIRPMFSSTNLEEVFVIKNPEN